VRTEDYCSKSNQNLPIEFLACQSFVWLPYWTDNFDFPVGLLLESEKVGLATAEELSRQKEQLQATEAR
jgi:hypothetical protein